MSGNNYELDPQVAAGCGHWERFGDSGPCGSGMDMLLSAENNGDGTIKLTLELTLNYFMFSNIVRFVNNNVRDALSGSIELTLSSSEDLECDWSGCTATVEAVPLDLSVFAREIATLAVGDN